MGFPQPPESRRLDLEGLRPFHEEDRLDSVDILEDALYYCQHFLDLVGFRDHQIFILVEVFDLLVVLAEVLLKDLEVLCGVFQEPLEERLSQQLRVEVLEEAREAAFGEQRVELVDSHLGFHKAVALFNRSSVANKNHWQMLDLF